MNKEENNNAVFETMPVPKALASMAIPMIISQLIVLIYNMADTFFLGRTNNPAMIAGASLILPVFNVCTAIANIAGTGGGTQISRLLGVSRLGEARRMSAFSFYFSLCVTLLFSILTAVFLDPLLHLLGAEGAVKEYARQYALCVIVFGAVPAVLSVTMANLLRSIGQSGAAGFGLSLGGILNIVLDPLFMFVLLPEGKETLGAGMATVLSNLIACLYFLITLFRLKSDALTLSPRAGRPSKGAVHEFFSVGLPSAVGPFLFDLDYMVIGRLMSAYGEASLAAIGIVLKVERFPLNVGIGLSLGMIPIVAYNYSAGNFPRMRQTLTFTRRTGIVIALISILLYEIFAYEIISFFITDPETVEAGAEFLRIRVLATVLMFCCFLYAHFFEAIGEGRIALFLVVTRWALLNIPMLFVLNALFGKLGIVWSQVCCDAVAASLSTLVYRRYMKRKPGLSGPGD